MFALEIEKGTNRVIGACVVNKFTPISMPRVASLPDGDINYYLFINGKFVKDTAREQKELEEQQKQEQAQAIQNEINALKQNLARTDYKAIKYAEGLIPEEEYASIRQERQAWRDRINELEK